MGRKIIVACSFLFSSMGLLGCGGQQSGTVTGQVSFGGKPITFGVITFVAEKGEPKVSNASIWEGKYSFEKIPVGTVKVLIQSLPASKPGTPPKGTAPVVSSEPTKEVKGPFVPIPAKYSREETSGLTYTVVSGNQTKDFNLEP